MAAANSDKNFKKLRDIRTSFAEEWPTNYDNAIKYSISDRYFNDIAAQWVVDNLEFLTNDHVNWLEHTTEEHNK